MHKEKKILILSLAFTMVSPTRLANINFKIFKQALLDDITNEIFGAV